MGKNDLTALLKKFDDGETTLAEEALLANTLAEDEQYPSYRAMFALFKQDRNVKHTGLFWPRVHTRFWSGWSLVAALLLVALCLVLWQSTRLKPLTTRARVDWPADAAVTRIQELYQGSTTQSTAQRLAQLAHYLNTDPSANVRVAAVSALADLGEEDDRAKILTQSYYKQEDTLVKLCILSQLRTLDRDIAIRELARICNQEAASPELKALAQALI